MCVRGTCRYGIVYVGERGVTREELRGEQNKHWAAITSARGDRVACARAGRCSLAATNVHNDKAVYITVQLLLP